MTNVRRFVAVVAFLGLAAYVSTTLQGQPGKKTGTTPQLTPATQVSQLADASESRFGAAGVITYQPVKGDLYFALQLKPTLEAAPARPRDILIMLSTAATQGGASWIAGHQIAEGVIDAAKEFDRISLWTVNAPENTKNISKDFLQPKDYGENKRLRDALAQYRAKEFPAGDTDLKTALNLAIKSFDSGKHDRQRIILFLGDGLSTHNPMTEDDRLKIAGQMVKNQIAFFPVPLGIHLNPNTLHGLANSTGGAVLRTKVEDEKLADAMKRYEEAFAGAVLYGAELKLPAGVSDVCPATLPPLRSDTPTLVVGRMTKADKKLDFTITGKPAGKKDPVTVPASEAMLPPSLDNYFLVGMIDQWVKSKDYPAVLRADRALVHTYEQTRLQHQEYLATAQAALQENKLEAASSFFKQARSLAPHDPQADAGVKIVDRLKDGTINKEMIRKQLNAVKADQLKLVNGKPQWVKVDLVALVQEEKAPENKQPAIVPKGGNIAPENLLKEHRDRQAIEEQKIANSVDDAIRQARKNLANDPDGTLDLLKNLKSRVQDHPDLGAQVRDALVSRLQTALRESATDVQQKKLKKQDQQQAVAVAEKNLVREQERKSFEERTDAQFRIYKNLMNVARYEEKTKYDIIQAMVQIQDEARLKGHNVPLATKAMYDIALAAYPLQTHNSLIRQREEKWLSILMGIEKSHIPYPDEPAVHFPPLATWKALSKYRKDKYQAIGFPTADEKGSEEASAIVRLLGQTFETKGFAEPMKLRKAIEIISDKFGGKLGIVVDTNSFMTGDEAGAPDPYDSNVSLPEIPAKISLGTALDIMSAQAGKGGTYIVNRDHVLITTYKRVLEEKVQRVHSVGDLFTMPFQKSSTYSMMAAGGMGAMGGFGGMPGMMMGGMPGMMMGGMGGMPGMMMGGMGGMPGMMMGGMPGMMAGGMPGMMMGGMPGMMAGGMPGMMMGGMPGMGGMQMGGMMMGGMPGMMMGGMPMGGGMMMQGGMMMAGGMGMGGMQFGGMGMGGGMQMGGGGSDIMQAQSLMQAVALIVRPGTWNLQQMVPQTYMMGMFGGMMFGFPGGMGMVGVPGGMGMAGMVGAPPPGDPNFTGDPLTSNSISYFPAGMSIVVHAPSRIHTSHISVSGGSRPKLGPAAALERDPKGIAIVKIDDKKDPKADPNDPKVAANREPAKLWNDAFAKGGINQGHIIATADFLFNAGEFKHAAEFLKANLRHGIAVRPWVFESLAVALEMSGGDKVEIQRVRLSGIALDPTDSQGFLSAARAMADRGQHDRALAFCKQAALLEPTDYHPYEFALVYAENARDVKGMEWAVGNLVSQDWPVDNILIQALARKRLGSLAATLKTEKRGAEAVQLETALERLNQRDLTVQLAWENTGGACELELKVKEPAGSVCNLDLKQSPGGGIMLPYNLTDKSPSCQYIAAQAFSGEYEIAVSRIYGQPLGNRARLIVTRNAGTKQEVRTVEIVQLDKSATFKINLKDGRRTELASVSNAANVRHDTGAVQHDFNAVYDLRAIANPSFYGVTTGPRGSAGSSGASIPSVAGLAAKDSQNKTPPMAPMMQNAVNPTGGGVQMTAQVRMNPDNRNYEMVIRPFFDAAARTGRPSVNLSVIPGGGN